MKSTTLGTAIVSASLGALACGDAYLTPALRVIDEDDLARHIRILAADEYEGRAPSSRGEQLTVQYLADAFEEWVSGRGTLTVTCRTFLSSNPWGRALRR